MVGILNLGFTKSTVKYIDLPHVLPIHFILALSRQLGNLERRAGNENIIFAQLTVFDPRHI